ncbi:MULTISPECIES: ATP-dependent zinc metalloprotease FtsH [unclassified Candidatus Frackibacter]|uniref:ATP-dependent zinc metalloprotease FtsH n=1 Tax=unclassified Candidatus Frackibacter TaxID=2648818 RepID=UPI0008925670|nr:MULTISPECIES: ATP-dependent zinc metalloprotease FtsH [unclassified Candidatus Frackibacter]SDC67033.1 cell division protease FtsH [Candidatus Frackibacter sp. WG11]SFL90785.1 cell division protease FtsH [Candidatus Frackibacter sp. WG13]
MNRFSKNIGFYLIIIAIAFLIAQYFISPAPVKQDFSYSQFITSVKKGKIDKVTIVGEEIVKGKTPEGNQFEINIPGTIEKVEQILQDNEVAIETKPEPEPPWWASILGYLLPTILIFGFWFFIMQRMQGGGNKVMSFGKNKARRHDDEKKQVTFDDVANYEEVKEELVEVVEFLKSPDKFNKLGAEIPKGVLLVGPPGTGKTLMARAVAGEAGVPFFIISGSDFVEMFVGVGASRVRDLFEQGKENSPCIIFIDELDAVGRQRGAGVGGGHDEREQTLNQLLVEMDGFEPNEGIILMAATNRPDVLDPALLRPGRFDRQVIVDKPDFKGRKGVLEIHVKDKPLADDVRLDILAKRTPGFTGADMENLANEAAILAARRDKDQISMLEFDDAIDRVIAGPQKKSRLISDKEKDIVSYHETGHALLGELLEHSDPTHKVSIIPRGRAGGFTINLPEADKNFVTKSELIDRVTALLGGRVAEEVFLDEISTGAQNDLERATKIVRGMITEYGMSDEIGPLTLGQKNSDQVFLGRDISRNRNYSEDVAALIDKEVKNMIENAYDKATRVLSENSAMVEKMVEELKDKETLTSSDIKKIIAEFKGDYEYNPDNDELEAEDTQPVKSEEPEDFGTGLDENTDSRINIKLRNKRK